MKRILSVFLALIAAVAIVGPAIATALKTLVNVGVETNGGIVRL